MWVENKQGSYVNLDGFDLIKPTNEVDGKYAKFFMYTVYRGGHFEIEMWLNKVEAMAVIKGIPQLSSGDLKSQPSPKKKLTSS